MTRFGLFRVKRSHGIPRVPEGAFACARLLPLTIPDVSGATPNAGTTAGGQTVTISGTGIQPDAAVVNPGSQIGTLSGADLVLTRPATGQTSFTIYRHTPPTGFTGSTILQTTAGTIYTDVGAVSSASSFYYQVN